jgi:hypothetical protein
MTLCFCQLLAQGAVTWRVYSRDTNMARCRSGASSSPGPTVSESATRLRMGADADSPPTPATDRQAGATGGARPCRHLLLLLDRPNPENAALECDACNLFIRIHHDSYTLWDHLPPWGTPRMIASHPYAPARRLR